MDGIVRLTEADVMNLGLNVAMGFFNGTCEETQLDRFRSCFGLDPRGCVELLNDLQMQDLGQYQISKFNAFYFMMTLYWLRNYPKERPLAAQFKVSERTVEKMLWLYVRAIQGLIGRKVEYSFMFDNWNMSLF
jgi:hypothetical protein